LRHATAYRLEIVTLHLSLLLISIKPQHLFVTQGRGRGHGHGVRVDKAKEKRERGSLSALKLLRGAEGNMAQKGVWSAQALMRFEFAQSRPLYLIINIYKTLTSVPSGDMTLERGLSNTRKK